MKESTGILVLPTGADGSPAIFQVTAAPSLVLGQSLIGEVCSRGFSLALCAEAVTHRKVFLIS
jgi:hypothetical protein